jgi:hypothetical protein
LRDGRRRGRDARAHHVVPMELVAKATSQAAKQARMMDTTIDVMK